MGNTIRYELELLLHLKESPLCVKPKELPAPEEYMGVPADPVRTQTKVTTDRPFGSLAQPKLESGARRPAVDRHGSRNGISDGLVLGPPRSTFPSSNSRTPFGENDRNDKTQRDSEPRDRFQRTKMGAAGGDNDTRVGGRSSNFRGRDDADREGEGWNKVKPRKSFGQDGTERFTGRMGGESHRQQRDDRGKDRDDPDSFKDRRRTFDTDGEDGDAPRRNGPTRGKPDSWSRETAIKQPGEQAERTMNRERIEKVKSWRSDDKAGNARGDRGERGRGEPSHRNNERHDRRWDTREREQRPERAPEWMDEPVQEQNVAHTHEDFMAWKERTKRAKNGAATAAELPTDRTDGRPDLPSFFTADPPAVQSAPATEQKPDAFFAMYSSIAATPQGDNGSEATSTAAKGSKFFPLFAQPAPQPAPQPTGTPVYGGITAHLTSNAGLLNGRGAVESSQAKDPHFASLMTKLKNSRVQGTPTPPNANALSQPPPPPSLSNQSPVVTNEAIRNLTQATDQQANLSSPDPSLPFGLGRPEEPRLRSVPPQRPEIMAPRPMQPPSQPPTVRNDQLIQEMVAQRHNAQSQGSGRPNLAAEHQSASLMQILQQQGQRSMETAIRLPPQNQRQPSMHFEPEPNPVFMRDHGLIQQRQMPPPAGFDNQFRRSEGDSRMMQQQHQQQQQPPPHPHILQRQQMVPPGLEHGPLLPQQMWPGQQPPLGQRQGPMIPQPQMQPGARAPPGLPFGPGPAMGNGLLMNGLLPNMLQSGDNMPGPPRGMPPPGFFAGGPPPHGPNFMPPPGMGVPFPGPDAFYQPGPAPYDGRGGMPPPGGAPFRR